MNRGLPIFRVLKSTTRQHWAETFGALVFTIVFSLMPIWIGAVTQYLLSRPPDWMDYLRHGEFGLYSAAMLAPAIYLILNDLKEPFPRRGAFGLLAFVMLALSVTVYVGVTTIVNVSETVFLLNESFLAHLSVWLYLASVVFALLVTVVDKYLVEGHVRAMYGFEQAELRDQFRSEGNNATE